MIDEKQLLSDYSAALDQKEKELIAQKRAVRAFLKTNHKEKDTLKYLLAIEEADERMEDILASLLDLKASSQFRDEAEKLCARCAGLDRYTSNMNKALSDDLAQKKKVKIDWVKNTTFLFGLPISFFLAVKNGLFHNHVTPEQATGVGFAIGSGFLAVDKISAAFKAAGRVLCLSARKAAASTKKAYAATKQSCREKKERLGQKTQRITAATRKNIRKLFGGPET